MDIQEVFSAYEIDINFALRKNEEDLYQLFLKIDINPEKMNQQQLPGYEMFCECIGIFEIDESKITQEQKQILLTSSALVMNINFLRTFLATVTGQFPFGKYWLPSIDMNYLLAEKNKEMTSQKKRKRKKLEGE